MNSAAAREDGFTWEVLSWAGAFLISFIGLLHLLQSEELFGVATYLGILFLANFVASSVAAIGMARRWGTAAWLLGDLIAGLSLAGLLLSRVTGLPGYPATEAHWLNFPALAAFMLDGAFLTLSLLIVTRRGRALVGAEQSRIRRERLPPAQQQTPEHFRLLEEEMAVLRDRMSSDLTDLRDHIEPRAVEERKKKDLKKRLRAVLPPSMRFCSRVRSMVR